MLKTTNYGLNKLELTDSPPDITALNPNFDKIDTQLKTNADSATSANNNAETRLPKAGGNVTGNLTVQEKHVIRSVNGQLANENGEVVIDVKGDVRSVNGVRPDSTGNVTIKAGVVSVNGVKPNEETGDIDLGERIKDASSRTDILEAVSLVGLDSASIAKEVEILKNTVNLASERGHIGDTTYRENQDVDLNTFTHSGVYCVMTEVDDPTTLNYPAKGGMNGFLVVHATDDGNHVRQTYYRIGTVNANDFNVFTRTIQTGVGGTWYEITSHDCVTGFSVSGTKVTYTRKNGTTGSFTTQDTNTNNSCWTISRANNGYSYDTSTGFCIQWGYYGSIASETAVTITFPRAFNNACLFFVPATPTMNGGSRGIFSGQPLSKTQGQIANGNDAVTDARWFAVGY